MVEYLETPYEIIDKPLWWHEQGLSQTVSGYGRRLTSRRCVKLASGAVRRVYVTQISNAGSAWINHGGKRLFLRDA